MEDVNMNAEKHTQTVHEDLLTKMTSQQIDEMYKIVARMTH
jgi:hypothetical protein